MKNACFFLLLVCILAGASQPSKTDDKTAQATPTNPTAALEEIEQRILAAQKKLALIRHMRSNNIVLPVSL